MQKEGQLEIIDQKLVDYLNIRIEVKNLHKNVLDGMPLYIEGINGEEVKVCAGRFDPAKEQKLTDGEFAFLMGEVKSASGHRFHAMVDVCLIDSMEHYGMAIWVLTKMDTSNGKVQWEVLQQNTPEFEKWVTEMERNVKGFKMFPYKYRYLNKELRHLDHHVHHNTGWSLA